MNINAGITFAQRVSSRS